MSSNNQTYNWQIDENQNNTYPYTNPYQPPKKPKRASGKMRSTALLFALCMELSAACGFGGAAAANLLTAKTETESVITSSEASLPESSSEVTSKEENSP